MEVTNNSIMTTLTTNGIKLLIVEVPEDAKDFRVFIPHEDDESDDEDGYNEIEGGLAYDHDQEELIPPNDCGGYTTSKIYIPDEVSLLGTITSGKVDFDVSELVEKQYIGAHKFYKNYVKGIGCYEFKEIHDSFLSLLQSKGIEYKKCVVLRIN